MRDLAPEEGRTPRQHWLSILARARSSELEAIIAASGGVPAHIVVKPAEVGTVMVEGRAGGTGVRFNLGEATVARCVVRIADVLGVSYALGSDRRRAHLAALIDALLQMPGADPGLHDAIGRLAEQQAAARDLASRKAATTKVEFFTMVRGNE
ncbi:MAG: phosphonate C-P lyase system protein PhnG [Hyphomicrobiaceae bacterium]|nr:phosphonate C-P lyase system protein PhnG [Hyphomicrobiaceae bacterium]